MLNREQKAHFCAARRRAVALEFSSLNPEQREGVLTTEGPVLLLAGAGSGKTTVLIERIVNLLKYGRGSDSGEVPDHVTEEDLAFLEGYIEHPDPAQRQRAEALCRLDPAAPWSVLAITFTNKAAGELKERLKRRGMPVDDIWAATFHSACVRILRREIERLGYPSSFTIYDTDDCVRVIKDILKELNLDDKMFPPKSVLGQISRAKDQMLLAGEYVKRAEAAGDLRLEQLGKIYAAYEARLRAAGAVDFDDIILCTVRLLLEHEEVRSYYQRKFRYVMVDEYQDTNHLQYLLTSTLAGGHRNICVVGDDDQSIYRFRGATIENILSFEAQYKKAKIIRLERNYRSTSPILEAANAVIRNNQGRKGKNLWTDRVEGETVEIHTAMSERDEAQYVAGRILAGFSKHSAWKDFAVLYRMNAQSNQMEQAFKKEGIPYRIIGGTRFFDRAEVKDMLAYLCVLHNPADDLRLTRIINTPARGIGLSTIERAKAIATQQGISLWQVIGRAHEHPDLQRAAAQLGRFVELMDGLRALLDEGVPLPEWYEELVARSGYAAALEAKDTVENRVRLENVMELKSSLITHTEEHPQPGLATFLDEVSLYTDLDNHDPNADCVVMMTIHSAKGLEFPEVFVVGAEEGIFPGIRAIGEPDEMEEERRLCYVAMTRAKRRLTMTCAMRRTLFGRTSANRPSRFVEEIPEQYVQRSGGVGYGGMGYGDGYFDDLPPWERHTGGPSGAWSGGQTYAAPVKSYSGPGKPAAPRPPVGGGHAAPPHTKYGKPAAPRPPVGGGFTGQGGQKASAPLPPIRKGDAVKHAAFGHGMVVSVQPMGGDALIEVAFDTVGTKKLMLKTAARHMEILSGQGMTPP